LKEFPRSLPESLEQLHLQYNLIELVPTLPSALQVLLIGHNKVKNIVVTKRKTPLAYLQLTNNQLTFSFVELQLMSNDFTWVKTVDEADNWCGLNFITASELIKRAWRRYRLKKTLRTWLKTARVKEELIATAMHPSRYGHFEEVTS